MPLTIDFESIFSALGLPTAEKSGNKECPFCHTMTFKCYDDGKAHCHKCEIQYDVVSFYAQFKDIGREAAFQELVKLYGTGKVKRKPKSYAEARNELLDDLEFLAWCRMYFAFYKSKRRNQKYYQVRSGVSGPEFSRIINGNVAAVSAEKWRPVVYYLRKQINLVDFKRDLNSKEYFSELLNDDVDAKRKIDQFK